MEGTMKRIGKVENMGVKKPGRVTARIERLQLLICGVRTPFG